MPPFTKVDFPEEPFEPPPNPPLPKEQVPSYDDRGQWKIPVRNFGYATFQRSAANNGNVVSDKVETFFDEWKIAPICINPNSAEVVALNPGLSAAEREDLYKRLNPNVQFYDSSMPYRAVMFNSSLVTSTKVNTLDQQWRDTIQFWAYPNGEFRPVITFDNASLYYNKFSFPPTYGNPQKEYLDRINTRYEFLKYEDGVFNTTTPNETVRYGKGIAGRNWITKTFPVPGAYSCTLLEFAGVNGVDPAPGVTKQCERINGAIDTSIDDILAIYPLPPDLRQPANKPFVRYSSRMDSTEFNTWPINNSQDERWIYPRYYRTCYLASDMQCAITKKPNIEYPNRNQVYQTFHNGYSFADGSQINLVKDPTRNAALEQIQVTCNPALLNRTPTSAMYVQTMKNYCANGSESNYVDSMFEVDPNINRNDEEGNKLGLGTLDRWNSPVCKNFSKENLLESQNNFDKWCNKIENWVDGGGCYNMANSVTQETQAAVNRTLIKLCEGKNLDSIPCLTYCFGNETNNLDCSSALGTYCKKLVQDEIDSRVTQAINMYQTGSGSNRLTNVQVSQSDLANRSLYIEELDDGIKIKPNNTLIELIADKVNEDHPQCPCFMPVFVLEAYYNRITEEFPPSPELNAFLLHMYQIPQCSYVPCSGIARYRPRNLTFPVVERSTQVDNIFCPKGSKIDFNTYEIDGATPEAPKITKWKYVCTRVLNSNLLSDPIPSCRNGYNITDKCTYITTSNSIVCTSKELPCSRETKIVDAGCPNAINCITNSIVRVDVKGVRVESNFIGDVNVVSECNIKLSRFSRQSDTSLVSAINPTQSMYNLCYANGSNHKLVLNTLRAQNNFVPIPKCVFQGFFSVSGSGIILTVTSIKSGAMPSPADVVPGLPSNPVIGRYVAPGTIIESIVNEPAAALRSYNILSGGQSFALGTLQEPLDLFIQADPVTLVSVPQPSYYDKSDNLILFKTMDFVKIYESNPWQTFRSAQTSVTATLNHTNRTISISGASILNGPIGPGKISGEGITAGTELTELESGSVRPFTTGSSSVWKYKSNIDYSTNIGPIKMTTQPDSTNRYVTGYVSAVYDPANPGTLTSGQIEITCLETNEEENQLQWSSASDSYATLNSYGQIATHWTIVRDGDDQYTGGGDLVDEDTYETLFPEDPELLYPYPKSKGNENIQLQDAQQVKSSGQIILIVALVIILLIIVVLIMILIVGRKNKSIKAAVKKGK